MSAGYSGTPLPKKLGIKPGHGVVVLNPPTHVDDLLIEAPDGVEIRKGPLDLVVGLDARATDIVMVFCADRPALLASFSDAERILAWTGGLWACWPKQSSPLATELKEDDVRKHGLATGLVDNKICAVDQDWSGLRFVHRVENRPRS